MSGVAGVDKGLLLPLWGFKTWGEMALDDGSINTTDGERYCLRWLLRVDGIRADRDAIAAMRGRS